MTSNDKKNEKKRHQNVNVNEYLSHVGTNT